MIRSTVRFLVAALLLALMGSTPGFEKSVQAAPGAEAQNLSGTTNAVILTKPRTIHAPYFPVGDVTAEKFPEMGLFWFGRVNSSENYIDTRVGYNDSALYVHASIFDRLVRYDPTHNPARLTSYDSVTVYVNTGSPTALYPNGQTFRFDAQVSWFEDQSLYQAGYRGGANKWQPDPSLAFTGSRGYAGGQFNNGKENRGWAMGFTIPFASLGLTEKPADGSTWGLAVVVHDRDYAPPAGMAPTKLWPETASGTNPKSWGRLVFGTLQYSPAPSTAGGTVVIRHKLNGAVVNDTGAGGDMGRLCDTTGIWTRWGGFNFARRDSTNIQNQSNLHDWPCFSKFYITFPLAQVPRGKVIVSARLILHEWGGSDWTLAEPSLIQISTVRRDWYELTLTWNNAPIPLENVSQAWVDPVPHGIQPSEWPGWAYDWDLSAAAAEAYKAGAPLRLAVYEADSAMHSGKYFSTSQAADWNASGRPTLEITWGNPVP